jgi:hypothetical protein
VTDQPTAPDRPALRPGLAAVLANPAYRRLFAAQTISRWSDTFNLVALVVLVFRLTGSGLGVSGVVVAEIAPVLLLAPLAGVLVDRLPRVRVMIAADLWRMALAGVLLLVDQHLAAVYAVAFGLAAGGVFFNPAASSVLPSIVDDDELVAANSGLWSAAVISQIALAPLAARSATLTRTRGCGRRASWPACWTRERRARRQACGSGWRRFSSCALPPPACLRRPRRQVFPSCSARTIRAVESAGQGRRRLRPVGRRPVQPRPRVRVDGPLDELHRPQPPAVGRDVGATRSAASVTTARSTRSSLATRSRGAAIGHAPRSAAPGRCGSFTISPSSLTGRRTLARGRAASSCNDVSDSLFRSATL